MARWLVLVTTCAACGGSPHRPVHPVVPAQRVAHYENARFKIGAVIDVADVEHPVIRLDGDPAAERLAWQDGSYVDAKGRPILRFVDAESAIVFVHGGGVGVELGRDR